MKLALSGIAAAVMLAVLPVAQAAERNQSVNGRQAFQQHRMQQGVQSGQVTRPEARALNREARAIEHRERSYRSDGNFSRAERREVHRDLDRHGRNINEARRNDHQRPGHSWGRDHGWQNGHAWGRDHNWQRGQGWHNGWYNNRGHGTIDQRQAFQHNRIGQGIRSGELTRGEARGLMSEQRRIENIERAYRSDGHFSRDERADIQRRLDMAQRHIYRETHDADRRY